VLAFLAMRTTIAIVLAVALAACSKGNEGAEEARKQAEKEQKEKAAAGGVAKKISPPVPGRAKLDCANVINPELYRQALGETEPVTVTEDKSEPDAAASCAIVRGGKRPSAAEQAAKLKKEGRLGVMPGDPICTVSTFCWTIEDPEAFRKKCAAMKDHDDESLGFYSCVLIVPQGVDDVKRFRFYDDDTKCVIQVRGGPSNVDNDLISKCAKTAHDLIGPDQIKVGAAPAEPAPEAGSAAK
jgi:hypothetical protein